MKVRLFFATDVHGSEACWRKFINSGKHYEADVLILGGDMTGKAVVPIVIYGSGRYRFLMQDQRHDFEGAEELARSQRLIRDHGYYPVVMTEDQVHEYSQHPEKLDAVFEEAMRDTIQQWVAFADERLAGTDMQCIVCPGNDDKHDIDEILATSSQILVGRGQRHRHAGYQLVQRVDQSNAVGHAARGGRDGASGPHRGRDRSS